MLISISTPRPHFLFGESIESLAGGTSDEAQTFLKAFDFAMFGSGFRIALDPFKLLFRDSEWHELYTETHKFAEKYVNKALKYRCENLSNNSDSARENRNK